MMSKAWFLNASRRWAPQGYLYTKEAPSMKSFKYVIYREGKYYVSQCLNIDIASCGDTIEDAINNLKDAVELYSRNEPKAVSVPTL